MRKILHIAVSEYRQVVLTRSFVFSLLFPFVVYGGMFIISAFFGDQVDTADRRFAIVDSGDGRLAEALVTAAGERNTGALVWRDGRRVGPAFVPEIVAPAAGSAAEQLLELSARVRAGELFAFVIIGADYLPVEGGRDDTLRYHSASPTFDRLPEWLERSLRAAAEQIRFAAAGLDERAIRQLTSHNRLERFGLAAADGSGELIQPRGTNRLAAMLAPLGLVLLIFISIQMTSPILLNAVVEEKMQRIAEVLLASVSAGQLLGGKLLAGVGAGLTFAAVYLISLALSLAFLNAAHWVPPAAYAWFFPFLLCGLLTFGSIFAAFSAASQDLKDTQNFAGAVALFLVVPLMLTIALMEAPDGPVARTLSFIPPISPLLMIMRVAVPPGPAAWEPWLAWILGLMFAVVVIWLAGRIFRIGILSHGRTPGWRDILRWAFRE